MYGPRSGSRSELPAVPTVREMALHGQTVGPKHPGKAQVDSFVEQSGHAVELKIHRIHRIGNQGRLDGSPANEVVTRRKPDGPLPDSARAGRQLVRRMGGQAGGSHFGWNAVVGGDGLPVVLPTRPQIGHVLLPGRVPAQHGVGVARPHHDRVARVFLPGQPVRRKIDAEAGHSVRRQGKPQGLVAPGRILLPMVPERVGRAARVVEPAFGAGPTGPK